MSELVRNLLNNLLEEELDSMELFLSNRMTYSILKPNNENAQGAGTVSLINNDEIVKITTIMNDGCKNNIYIPIDEITFIGTVRECPAMEGE